MYRTRAAGNETRVLLPRSAAGPAFVVMLVTAAGATPANGAFAVQQGPVALGRRTTTGKAWLWQVLPLLPGQDQSTWDWLTFRPPPEVDSTPFQLNPAALILTTPDLVRIAYIGVIPITNAPSVYSDIPNAYFGI
jgi:hypothetical protein